MKSNTDAVFLEKNMAEPFFEAIPMAQRGYCCSQILVKLIMDAQGEENAGLLRSLQGLCKGMAGRHGVCGLLTGGVCALAYVTGKGGMDETAHPMAEEMRYKYLEWFKELVKECGGMDCARILGGSADDFNMRCNELLGQCWRKLLEIFDEYEIEWTMPLD